MANLSVRPVGAVATVNAVDVDVLFKAQNVLLKI